MTLKELTKKPLPKIAEADKKRINTEEITPTAFCDKNEILSSEKLQNEMGFKKLFALTYREESVKTIG